jgi:hypothetical protein
MGYWGGRMVLSFSLGWLVGLFAWNGYGYGYSEGWGFGGAALWEGWVEVAIPRGEWILYHEFGVSNGF